MARKINSWDAPENYWYTQRTLEQESERTFRQHLRSANAHYIDDYVLWTDEQKAEWEMVWLTEPEGE